MLRSSQLYFFYFFEPCSMFWCLMLRSKLQQSRLVCWFILRAFENDPKVTPASGSRDPMFWVSAAFESLAGQRDGISAWNCPSTLATTPTGIYSHLTRLSWIFCGVRMWKQRTVSQRRGREPLWWPSPMWLRAEVMDQFMTRLGAALMMQWNHDWHFNTMKIWTSC